MKNISCLALALLCVMNVYSMNNIGQPKLLTMLRIIDTTDITGKIQNAIVIERKADASFWGPMMYDCPIKDTVNVPLFEGDIVSVYERGFLKFRYTPTGKFSTVDLIISKGRKGTKAIGVKEIS